MTNLAHGSKETIAAIATPAGKGGIGVVRVSGPLVAEIAVKSMHKGKREVMPGIVNKPLPLVTKITPMWLQLIIVKWVLK